MYELFINANNGILLFAYQKFENSIPGIIEPHLRLAEFLALDAMKEGYKVYLVVDAVGGTSLIAEYSRLKPNQNYLTNVYLFQARRNLSAKDFLLTNYLISACLSASSLTRMKMRMLKDMSEEPP